MSKYSIAETTTDEAKTTPSTEEIPTSATMTISDVDKAIANGEGKWVSAACWHNCGGH